MVAVIGKGHEDYQELNGVRHHFLDREVIEETVKAWLIILNLHYLVFVLNFLKSKGLNQTFLIF